MKISLFLTISAIGSIAFGTVMFLMPALAFNGLGITVTPQTVSLLQGMGGLIIGLGALNFLGRHFTEVRMLNVVLLTNILTHTLGLLADIFGVLNGALQIGQMAPVELTHLFIGTGSLIYLVRLKRRV
jgi:hypothetical protein